MRAILSVLAVCTLASCGGGSGGGSAPAAAPPPVNRAPVANAGTAQSIMAETTATLDGSQSSDADGDAVSFKWTLTSRPEGSQAALGAGNVAKPTFTPDIAGSYQFSLIVSDGKLDSAAASTVTLTATDPRLRTTSAGVVRGSLDAGGASYSWLGVPYAAPPTGQRRWRPPAAPVAWTETRDALAFGSACAQVSQMYDAPTGMDGFSLDIRNSFGQPVGSEDCLTMNIWRPRNAKADLPVLVYVHGGSNRGGWSGQYRGAQLAAEQGIVVVTVNYRLNLFGWLHHAALKTGDAQTDSANFGTLDLVQALKFVQQNIAAFGGDPRNVTLAGQSSGGSNVWSLMLAPQAANLFHKAVVISSIVRGRSPAEALDFSSALLRNLVVKDGLATDLASANAFLAGKDDAWIRQYLYGQPTATLLGLLGKTAAPGLPAVLSAPPAILYEGVVQPKGNGPDAGVAALAAGAFHKVPVLAGLTDEEGKLFASVTWPTSSATRWGTMWNFQPNNPAATPVALTDLIIGAVLPVTAGPTGTCGQPGYVAGFNHVANVCGVVGPGGAPVTTASYWSGQAAALNAVQPHQPKVFAYNFRWARQPFPWDVAYGATHTADLPFLFNDFGPGWLSFGFSDANKPGREALGKAMRDSLGAFMKSADPNHASLGTVWQAWSPVNGGPKRLVFDADLTTLQIKMSSSDVPGN